MNFVEEVHKVVGYYYGMPKWFAFKIKKNPNQLSRGESIALIS